MTEQPILPKRVDLFTTVHKGLRWWMGKLIADLGAATFADPASAGVLDELEQFLRTLDEHSHHEDTFIAPLIQARSADRNLSWQADHRRLDALVLATRGQLSDLRGLGFDQPNRQAIGLALYRAFCRLTAEILEHLDHEETVLMPLLWSACSDEELQGVMGQFLSRFGAESARMHARVAAAYTSSERAMLRV